MIKYWWNVAKIYLMMRRYVVRMQRQADAEGRQETYEAEATLTLGNGMKFRVKGDAF